MLIVTGAGSGVNYKLPTGDELKSEIIKNCLNPTRSYFAESQQSHSSYSFENTGDSIGTLMKRFGNVFGQSPSSIDLFLSRTTEINFKVGINILVKQILLYEANSKKFLDFHKRDRKDDWLIYLFNKIITHDTTIDNLQFKLKKLPKIITFNYDRLIEFNFETFLIADFAKNDDDKEKIKKMLREELDIVHVYGKIGNLDWGFNDNVLPYGSALPFEEVNKFEENIKLMYQDRKNIKNKNFKKLFEENKVIVFLGFAFDDFNIETLDLENMDLDKQKRIYGTIFEYNENEKTELSGKLVKIFGNSSGIILKNCNCKEMLRNITREDFN